MADEIPLPYTTWNGIPFNDSYDELEEGMDQTGVYAIKNYYCNWGQRWTFYQFLRGRYMPLSGGNLSVLVPAQYPDNTNLYAYSAVMTPVAPDGAKGAYGSASFKYAKIKVTFKSPQYNFDGSDTQYIGQTRLDFGGNMVTLPQDAYKFSDGTRTEESVGRLMPSIEHTITRGLIDFLPVDVIGGLIGKINSAPLWGLYDAETLLFAGASADRQADGNGKITWTVEYKFLYRPVSWNKVVRPDTGEWDYIADSGGDKIYQTGDFTTLP